eukprot:SAG11_NODE_367_length_10114_cov_16.930904_5_plen_64_part_00
MFSWSLTVIVTACLNDKQEVHETEQPDDPKQPWQAQQAQQPRSRGDIAVENVVEGEGRDDVER